MKSLRDVVKVVDVDWIGFDWLVLVIVEGCIQVFDLIFKLCFCIIEDCEFLGNSYICWSNFENKYILVCIVELF